MNFAVVEVQCCRAKLTTNYNITYSYYFCIIKFYKKMHRFSITILLLLLFLVSGCNRTQQSGEKHTSPGLLSSIDGLLEDGTGYEVILEEMAAR